MERLTQTSNKGGLAFTFDLDITCEESEIRKIAKLGERLKKYEDLEEQGLLLRLPVKMGEKLFTVENYSDTAMPVIYEYTFDGIEEDGLRLMYKGRKEDVCVFDLEGIGKTVFLTKEEAEQALKAMEGVDRHGCNSQGNC